MSSGYNRRLNTSLATFIILESSLLLEVSLSLVFLLLEFLLLSNTLYFLDKLALLFLTF
jgi:hypothetical protein